MHKGLKIGAILAVSAFAAGTAAPITANAAAKKTVTVGIVGTSDKKLWDNINKTTQKKYNLTVKTKVFTDYNQPNKAVADGSLDLNAFQHT